MESYFLEMSKQMGISVLLLSLMLLWTLAWKLYAMWIAARKRSAVWFLVLALINTMGLLPILYIFVFSRLEIRASNSRRKKPERKKRAKKP